MRTKLIDVAEVIRSKNAGPYELTFDIIFKDMEVFEKILSCKIFNDKVIAKLFNIPVKKVINIINFKPARAIKITIERPIASGALGETDIYGAQQHGPLIDFEFNIN